MNPKFGTLKDVFINVAGLFVVWPALVIYDKTMHPIRKPKRPKKKGLFHGFFGIEY